MSNTYSPNEFLEKLHDGKLQTPLICEGFAKPIENIYEKFLCH